MQLARLRRRDAIKLALTATTIGVVGSACDPRAAAAQESRMSQTTNPTTTTTTTTTTAATTRQPVLFVGHGSPMNAIEDNPYSRAWQQIGAQLASTTAPKAIVAVSAHWYTAGSWVTAQAAPPTVHDFGGFPRQLFEMQYPAHGSEALQKRVMQLVTSPSPAAPNDDWGYDHGTWSVLVHLRPKADIPVIQLSIDGHLRPEQHLAIGRALRPLRDEGVLILGSGNVTHNLRHAMQALRGGVATKPDWAQRFDDDVVSMLGNRDTAALAKLIETDHGRMSHPTPDHWLPMLYAAGAADDGDAVGYPVTGWDAGSLSMRSVRFG